MSRGCSTDASTRMDVRIDVYEADGPCQQCRATVRWLERRRVPYRRHDMNDRVRGLLVEAGFTQAPGVVVTTSLGLVLDVWGGFNPSRLDMWASDAVASFETELGSDGSCHA